MFTLKKIKKIKKIDFFFIKYLYFKILNIKILINLCLYTTFLK